LPYVIILNVYGMPSTFMKMIKGSANLMSAARNERRQSLNSRDIWDGTIDRFEVLEKMLKVIMRKLVQDTYLTQNFRLHTLREVHTVMLIFG
jgi:hypothetical protein